MATASLTAQKNKYRITLELNVNEDFNPHQINWNKLFELDRNEQKADCLTQRQHHS